LYIYIEFGLVQERFKEKGRKSGAGHSESAMQQGFYEKSPITIQWLWGWY